MMRLASGSVFGILGAILFVRIALIPAPFGEKAIGFAFPVVAMALAAVRIREYARARKAEP
jgi:hypothetical protein